MPAPTWKWARALYDGGADDDVELALAVEAEVADGSGVKASGGGFEVGDDLQSAFLRCAGDRPAGEASGDGVEVGDVGAELAFDGRDQVKDLFEALEAQEVGHAHAAVFADAPEIVAFQVGDHDEFGDFFGRGEQLVGGAFVAVGFRSPRAGAFDGTGDRVAAAEAQKSLRRSGEDGGAVEIEVSRVGSGRVVAKRFVERPSVAGKVGRKAVSEADLIDVACSDVVLGATNHRLEAIRRDVWPKVDDGLLPTS